VLKQIVFTSRPSSFDCDSFTKRLCLIFFQKLHNLPFGLLVKYFAFVILYHFSKKNIA
jgi:hypothetical protein